jgi:hypothetical protein
MKVSMLPDRFDLECETPEDWRSLVVHCQGCWALYRHAPGSRYARGVKAASGAVEDEFLAVAVTGCSRCTPGGQAPAGALFLGRFPGTAQGAAAVG